MHHVHMKCTYVQADKQNTLPTAIGIIKNKNASRSITDEGLFYSTGHTVSFEYTQLLSFQSVALLSWESVDSMRVFDRLGL